MLSDKEVEEIALQLGNFRTTNARHQDDLALLIERYGSLVEDYQRMKSDFEEARDSRERYKQMVKGQDKNPFVLVLIDGDHYIFDDDLVASGADGGQRAARLLDLAVKRHLGGLGLDHCRIMVRIYANLAGLSKALSKTKLVGAEKRSLAPFTANFTRSNDLFDFVDAGELKENADFKIRAMFRQFIDNPQCRQVYFAGCHDVGYINELTPYSTSRDRITLVRSYPTRPEFARLGLRVTDFPGVFRSLPLDLDPSASPASHPVFSKATAPAVQPNAFSSNENGPPVCRFYPSGKCKYGKSCKNLHARGNKSTDNGQSPNMSKPLDIRDWRKPGSKGPSTFGLSSLNKNDNDSFDETTSKPDMIPQNVDFATVLPSEDSTPLGRIPVNSDQYRIDTYLSPPSKAAAFDFNERIAAKKLCNNHHLKGYCAGGDACAFDHNPISPDVLHMLKTVARSTMCTKRGACRALNCVLGHICQRNECKYRGGKLYCKLNYACHQQYLHVAEWVNSHSHKETSMEDTGDMDRLPSISGQGSTPPLKPGSEKGSMDSDGELESPEGASLVSHEGGTASD